MANGLKGLAKDTVIYGMTNIVSKFLNWLLAPFYIRVLADTAEYGIVTNLYAWVSVVLVVLTLGLETGLFRFMSTEEEPDRVYGTCLRILSGAVATFMLIGLLLVEDIATAIGHPDNSGYVAMFIAIVSLDAVMSLPFAYLRCQKRPLRFAFYKFLFVGLNIFFNLLFLVLLPYLDARGVALPSWLYLPGYGVGYIFVSNLLASGIEALVMLPVLRPALRARFDKALVRRIATYCIPLVLLGLAGNFNKMAGQILIPGLFDNPEEGMSMVGLFGGNLKISVVMVMFLQAFRFAYDPFVFAKMKAQDAPTAYRVAMNGFVFFAVLIFLFVMFWMDIFKHIVRPDYYEGLIIVPYMMISEIIFGIYYNLSIWYKLSDRTYFGAIFSVIGLVLTVSIIIWGVPRYGIIACAWAAVACNTTMLLLSYLLGRIYHPIRYDTVQILFFLLLAVPIYRIGMSLSPDSLPIRLLLRSLWLIATMGLVGTGLLAPGLWRKILAKAHTPTRH